MQVQNTAAVDFNGMLTALRDFLAANGWTITSDGIAATSTLIVQNSNGHVFRLRKTTTNQNDYYTGAFVEQRCSLSYDLANTGGVAGTYSNETSANDMNGPYPNLWFITDDAATFCHVAVQCAPVRYGHFSFGNLDPKGLHTADISFCSALYWYYWSNRAEYANNNGRGNPFNDPYNGSHEVDYTDGDNIIGIPAGLLDTTLFFNAGARNNATHLSLCDREYSKTTDTNNSARWLDFFTSVSNKAFIGGIILSPMPIVTTEGSNDVRAFIGELPAIYLVNMQGLSPGQTITFADDDYLVFPWKQFGTTEAAKYGANPLPQPNSWRYGFAYRVTN